jgi:glycosyltransferase involved in cell wall biosynthesis
VDGDLFNPARRSLEWRAGLGVASDETLITFVSRLVTEKGLDIVIDASRRLAEKKIRHRMLFIGDGPERQRVERALPGAIFTGHLTGEPLAIGYASSDIFLFPSDTETFGNVTLEALSSGLPVVVADATGSSSLVENGVNGFLAEPGNAEDFLGQVETLISNPDLQQSMGVRARESAEAYEWDRVMRQMIHYYEEIR